MPTINEVKRLAETYGLMKVDYLVVPEGQIAPGNNERGPLVSAGIWYRRGKCDDFEFYEHVALTQEELMDSTSLSVKCAGVIGKSVGVVPASYRLTG